jgi:gliding motility-associated-like protein
LFSVRLTVENAEGCKTYAIKTINIVKPYVFIEYLSTTGNGLNSCKPFSVKLGTSSSDSIVSYKWTVSGSGGQTSTEAKPEFTFTSVGYYTVTLEYTTINGCKGTVLTNGINVLPIPKANFASVSGTEICGNIPVLFDNLSTGELFRGTWLVNGVQTFGEYFDPSNSDLYYRFTSEGKHTITYIANNGICSDTMTRENYITVKPPFVKIQNHKKTCDGTRGEVTFIDSSKQGTSWLWNFGDGTIVTYNTHKPNIIHEYKSSGNYKVKLSVTNGSCTVSDSVFVSVLLKQKPQLTVSNPDICSDQNLNYSITGLEAMPNTNGWYYNFSRIEYGDQSSFFGNNIYYPGYYIDRMPFNGSLSGVNGEKDKLRMILYNSNYGCYDTTNYISYSVKGAKAGFEIVNDNQCYQLPVTFRDTSKASANNSIVSWEWNFGDGNVQNSNSGGVITHTYANPGYYYVMLKVKDAAGCITSSSSYTGYAEVKGPKAAFSSSGTNVPLNSTIYFYNNTNAFNAYTTVYSWNFGDGTPVVNANYPSHTFTVAGTYTVTLTATDPLTGCTSTAKQVITVRNFNTAFSFNTSFVANTSCPPVIARFSNTSVGYVKVSWDFGDGTTAGNVNYPSHIYTKPGKYIVKLLVYGDNELKGTFIDSVVVKGQNATISFNPKESCSSQEVRFKGSSSGISSYLWDFGDGIFYSSADSVASHSYKAPGVYSPVLLGTNADGCTVAFPADDKITIDSLSAKISGIPAKACNEAAIQFNADVFSVGAVNNPGFLTYKWNFGTGNAADTSNVSNPLFKYTSPGTYTVSLQVRSKSGCLKIVTETVIINQSSKAAITAANAVCAGNTVIFNGNASISNGVQWKWDFKNGQQSFVQNPPAQLFSQPGNYDVSLIVNNNGCSDTAVHKLTVNPLPDIQLTASSIKLCAGNSVQLSASGGSQYRWTPAGSVSDSTISAPVASPLITTSYKVIVTTAAGCKKADSLTIQVIQPFKLTAQKEYTICELESIPLTVTGANSYKWIGNIQGLNTLNTGTVVARPPGTIIYTVVGFDAEGCFSDTAFINVTVNKRPFVNAGNDAEILPGGPYKFTTTSSADVIKWTWTPPDFLSCTQCESPVSTTTRNIEYVVTVNNELGCTATDSVTLKILCNGAQVFIPNSFTPNNDGLNDVFRVLGNGASYIKSFVIYNRWGNKVFERKDITADQPSAGWNGYYKGFLAPAGTYSFYVQLVCDATGDKFEHRGTVLLLQ